ncbi:MAG: carboxyl transferase [Frankiales bacterium]|jgi:acetyl-CoA carboxylase carboxyltransferase component|nr:carboxyl transferase [Frankiales bacterium]
MTEVASPLQGTVVAVLRAPGDLVREGQGLVVVEAMKMEHVVPAPSSGAVHAVLVEVGSRVERDEVVVTIGPAVGSDQAAAEEPLDAGRAGPEDAPDLVELKRRRRLLTDEGRPEAAARRREQGRRTVREELDDLLDPGSLTEYGGLALAAQRARRSQEELEQRTPADGLIAGIGRVDGHPTAVLAYDYSVLAGTQGVVGHLKTDRFLEVVHRLRLPTVLFAEGGGGRPGDTDHPVVSGLHTTSFALWAGLGGVVPRVGIVGGRCFAGNAALLGCCDVIIATRAATVGMGGPAMVEGGGLGTWTPEEIGPVHVQAANGVLDVVVDDDASAVAVAKQVLGLLRAPLPAGAEPPGACADQTAMRSVLPVGPARSFDPRVVLDLLADTGSVLELRSAFAPGMVTALARLDGLAVGVLLNDSRFEAGALTSDGCDKAARFLQLCDAFDLPVVSLIDTPGIMVGPEAEQTALVRHSSRLFAVGATLTVPVVAVVLRRAFGLGAQAMMLGSTRTPLMTLAWPSAELGPMGVEGSVRLAMRRELAALPSDEARRARVEELSEQVRERGKAVPVATAFEIDDVIDPAETREVVLSVLRSAPRPPPGRERKRLLDTW